MDNGSEDLHKINIRTLKAVYEPVSSYLRKIESLLSAHYREEYMFQKQSIVALMEMKVSCSVVLAYLEDLFSQAEEGEVDHLFLSPLEIKTISSIATSVITAASLPIENTNLMDH